MKFWTHQHTDFPRLDHYLPYRSRGSIRIHRLAFWRWAWIWSRIITPPPFVAPQIHSAGAEIAYMKRHPEIWPPKPKRKRRG